MESKGPAGERVGGEARCAHPPPPGPAPARQGPAEGGGEGARRLAHLAGKRDDSRRRQGERGAGFLGDAELAWQSEITTGRACERAVGGRGARGKRARRAEAAPGGGGDGRDCATARRLGRGGGERDLVAGRGWGPLLRHRSRETRPERGSAGALPQGAGVRPTLNPVVHAGETSA